MATSYPVRRPVRVLVVAATAAIGLSLSSGIGYAEPDAPAAESATPQTSAEAQVQVAEMNHQLEIVTEQYNDARVITQMRKDEAAAAEAQLADVRVQIADLDTQVRQLAVDTYTGEQAVGFTVLMTSGSPQEFLDRLNTLDSIAGYNSATLRDFTAAQDRAADLAAQADAAEVAAEQSQAQVEARKATIEADLPDLEALLATLTEEEAAAALARAHELEAAAAQASRDEARTSDTDATTSTGPADSEPATGADTPTEPSARVAAPSNAAQIAVDTAYAQLGDPYLWGAAGPNSFDCSGLTMYSYAAAGINLPHSSNMQSNTGQYVPRDQLQPGDLVFYYSPVSHVAIYVGNGQVIHAPNTGSVVQLADVDMWGAYSHAQRIT